MYLVSYGERIENLEKRKWKTDIEQEQPFPHLRHRHRSVSFFPFPGLWKTSQELEEVRGGHFLRSPKPQVWNRCITRRTKESILRLLVQKQLHSNTEEAKGLLLV
jgi:hypothetical protein